MSDDGKFLVMLVVIVGSIWYFNQSPTAPTALPAPATATPIVPFRFVPESERIPRERPEPEYDRPAPAPLPAGIPWPEARQHLGEWATICGPVISTAFRSDVDGSPTFLNIGYDFPNRERFQVVIWGRNLHNFDYEADTLYQGREICVSGDVVEFNGVVETEVVEPGQVEVR